MLLGIALTQGPGVAQSEGSAILLAAYQHAGSQHSTGHPRLDLHEFRI